MRPISAGLLLLAACAGPPTARPAATLYVADAVAIGQLDGVAIFDGGLSGLDVRDGVLWAVADRGPNLDAEAAAGRPAKRFALPDYTPSLTRLAVRDGRLMVAERRSIASPTGAATGRPPPAAGEAVVETAIGPGGATLAPDPWGIDAEGVAFDGADVWVTDEYRPSLWRLDAATGAVRERFAPSPASALDRPLPPVLAGRQANLGFEGIAILGGRVVASLQGPLRTETSDPATPVVRLLQLDPATGRAETFAYPMDGPLRKVGDLAALGDRLLVLEHGPGADGAWSGQVYAVELATPLGDAEPERYPTADAARAAGLPVLRKTLVLDLVAAGWPPDLHKPEGLAVHDGRLLVLSDNDYGVDAPAADGRPVATGQRTTLAAFPLPQNLRRTTPAR